MRLICRHLQLLSFYFLIISCASAELASTSDIKSSEGDVVTAARNTPPQYPSFSKKLAEQGRVEVMVLATSRGNVLDARVGKSSGFDRLDNSAVEAIKGWNFKSSAINDQDKDIWFTVPVNFSLDSLIEKPSEWAINSSQVIKSHLIEKGVAEQALSTLGAFYIEILPDGVIGDNYMTRSSGNGSWDRAIARALNGIRLPANSYGQIPRKAFVYIEKNKVYAVAISGFREDETVQSYEARVLAKIKSRFIYYNTSPSGLITVIELLLAADGQILDKRLTKSSNNKNWDEAVLNAVDRTNRVPRDLGGYVPDSLAIGFISE